MDFVPPPAHALLVQVHNLETLFLIEVYNQSHPPSLLRGASIFHFFPTKGKQTTLFAFPQSVFHSNMTPGTKGKVSRKKVAALFYFVQMRGGRDLPKFFVHFSQTVYIGSIWGWGGRGRPLPKFFGTLAFKKSGTSCPN